MKWACQNCGETLDAWQARCPSCRGFSIAPSTKQAHTPPPGSIAAELARGIPLAGTPQTQTQPEPAPDVAPPPASRAIPIRITDVAADNYQRTPTKIPALDRVLGGGIVVASVVLIGGEPGGGKSTLLAQALAGAGVRALYVTGEETVGQATLRARRVSAEHPEVWIVASNDVDDAIECAKSLRPAIVAIDSIQKVACRDVAGVQGSISQVRECTSKLVDFAKQSGIAVVLVGHVTKDGAIAGPRTLEHLVDVTLALETIEDVPNRRVLRAFKNRYGNTAELGRFEMTSGGMRSIVDHDEVAREEIAELAREADHDDTERMS